MGPLLPYRDVQFRDIVVFLSTRRARDLRGEADHRTAGRSASTCATAWCTATAWRWTSPTSITTTIHGWIRIAIIFLPWRRRTIPMCIRNWMVDLPVLHSGRRHRGASGPLLRHGRPSRRESGQPLLGIHSARQTSSGVRCLSTGRSRRRMISIARPPGVIVWLFLGKVVLHFFDETRWKRTLQFVR